MVKLQPRQALLVQRVYESIVGESWFNRNAVTERELLKLVLGTLAAGEGDEAEFLRLCRDAARARFSRSR